jgi:diadenosine tetraphosphate (Ap4A) HIT family hydrolase
MECKYFEKLKEYNYGDLIAETEYWLILLAPDQKNLGTCVVALKRDSGDLAELKDKEWQEFSIIVKRLESALKKSFNSTMFNWGCLMNSSYLKDPPNPHVHWHFIPRYNEKVKFEGIIFEDPYFGFSTMKAKGGIRKVAEDVRTKVIKEIKDNLEI